MFLNASVLQKIIYLLLLVSVGVVAPMSYFDAYSPHQVTNAYHITIFEDPTGLNRVAVALRQKQQQQRLVYALNRRSQQFSTISRTVSIPNFTQDLQLVVTPYTLADAVAYYANQQCLGCNLRDTLPVVNSADLPHPEKPPPSQKFPFCAN